LATASAQVCVPLGHSSLIKNCFVVAASYPFFVGKRGSVTHFSELGVTLPIFRMS